MIYFFVALMCEARPLIRAYHMKQICDYPFLIYKGKSALCIVTKPGQFFMQTAVAYVCGKFPIFDALINVGVAGHQEAAIGTLFICHSVESLGKTQKFYPSFHYRTQEKSAALLTVDHIETQYLDKTLYDQEGYAFCNTARILSQLEKIHLIKIVSDNLSHPTSEVSQELIYKILSDNITTIQKLAETMKVETSSLDDEEKWIDQLMIASFQKKALRKLYQTAKNRGQSLDLSKLTQMTTFSEMKRFFDV
jgi:hypothetical protein